MVGYQYHSVQLVVGLHIMDEHVLALIINGRLQLIPSFYVLLRKFFSSDHLFGRYVKLAVFIQERISHIAMIQEHQRLRTERLIFNLVRYRNTVFSQNAFYPSVRTIFSPNSSASRISPEITSLQVSPSVITSVHTCSAGVVRIRPCIG